MPVSGSRVAIVGGSIAGCAAAIALSRAGCEVVVYERSGGDLLGRGMGIGIPPVAFEELVSEGYLDRQLPGYRRDHRLWLTNGPQMGRVRWRQPFPALFTSWGVVWRALRSRVPQGSYRLSASVNRIEPDADGVLVATETGRPERFDAVVGADGYRSIARGLVDAGSQPAYVGYVVWRGNLPLDGLEDLAGLGMLTACYPGGHTVFYPTVGVEGGARFNWVMYGPCEDRYGFSDPQSLPPGQVPRDLLDTMERTVADHLPPRLACVVRATADEEVSIQPLYDCTSDTYASGRMLLAGDAGTVARPHTGSGAMKAMQDCLALQRACGKLDNWAEVLSSYDDQRRTAGNALVELGRQLGRPLVTHSPAWQTMQEADFQEWYIATQAGRADPYYRGTLSR
jgi:2-polyprenyl-6-methoxyphenol hydroxylase-like FAD-dependent oxidoreductase